MRKTKLNKGNKDYRGRGIAAFQKGNDKQKGDC